MNRCIRKLVLLLVVLLGCIILITDNKVVFAADNIPAYSEGTQLQSGNYLINSVDDWIALQKYSQSQDLSGCTFEYLMNEEQSVYVLNKASGFEGLGSEAYPFSGTISTTFDAGTITIQTETSFFQYLSSSAKIDKLNIQVMGSKCCAGLAENLVENGTGEMNLSNISITAADNIYITNSDTTDSCDYAGGLFANIVNTGEDALTVNFSNVSTSVPVKAPVNGTGAGGWIGHIIGNVNLRFTKDYEISNVVVPNNQTGNILGGLVGCVEKAENSANAEVAIDISDSLHLYCNGTVGEDKNRNHTVGSVFGKIDSSDVTVKGDLQVTGGNLYGKNIGGFAGEISNSAITFNSTFIGKETVFKPLKTLKTNGAESDWSAVGMFAGKVVGSTIQPGTSLTGTAITLYGRTGTDSYSVVGDANNNDNNTKYHIGGFAGYVVNSDLLFEQEHPCEIIDFTTNNTSGNVSAGMGYYETGDGTDSHTAKYFQIKNNEEKGMRLICWKDNCGVLVGKAVVKNSSKATVSNCVVNLKKITTGINAATSASKGAWSLGIGYLDNPDATDSNLSIQNVDLRITEANQGYYFESSFKLESYGGVIGIADANFEIHGAMLENRASGNTSDIQASNLWYYGGLVGEIRNQMVSDSAQVDNNFAKVRKISISDVSIGKNAFWGNKKDFGCLFGHVGKKTAVSLGENIKLNGNPDKSIDKQKISEAKGYIGSIAGSIDDSLIYIEPEAVASFAPSELITGNEIGNYGGVIRNRTVGDVKLIQDYQVTGTLDDSIDSLEDIIRLAIVLNTRGQFMPTGNTGNTLDTIRRKAYTLTMSEYDLRQTGLMCLGRNDAEGLNTPFIGSLTGVENGTTITYDLIGYGRGQSYLGLFPAVGNDSLFKNLKLKYDISYQQLKYTTNGEHTVNPSDEHAGGLACYADGNVTLENVSFEGKLKDYSQAVDKFSSNQFNGKYDYLGGLIGQYTGDAGEILSLINIDANMGDFTCSDPTHVMGGVIASIRTTNATKENPLQIKVSGSNRVSGTLTYQDISINNTQLENPPVQVSSFITVMDDDMVTGNSLLYTGKYAISVDNLSFDGVNQTITSNNEASAMGGLLGYQWADINGELKDISIGESGAKTMLAGNTNFGGLLHAAYGKLSAENVKWNNASLDAKNASGVDRCGLFVRDGQYLYLSVKDYVVTDTVALTNYSGSDFDELVGYNMGGTDARHGGIVSISSSSTSYLGKNTPAYQSYNAKLGAKKNANTRYYYDLDNLNFPTKEASFKTLDSADDIMIWHLLHYINPNIRQTLSSNTVTVPDSLPKEYAISGTIDMKGYSIYPTPVGNESYTATGAKISFDAKSIIEGEKTQSVTMYPEDENYQHYQMQSGLFGDVTGLSVDGLTVSGCYSSYSYDSKKYAGALVAGQIYGQEDGKDSNNKTTYKTDVKNHFKNITFNNLWCVSNASMVYDNPIGLMIADIDSGSDVTFDGISMVGYNATQVTQNNKAASALIGNVGSNNATYITLSFNDMDVTDAAQDKSSDEFHSNKSDEALAKASFIYSYDYAENSNGIYLFTYEDYLKGRINYTGYTDNDNNTLPTRKVTLGLELGDNKQSPNYAIEEYFDKDIPVGKLEIGQGIEYLSTNYLPYVCKTDNDRHILINPKVGDITEGCGTYEDPYQISSTKQMISLYRYLYKEKDFENILKSCEWKINKMGLDDSFCDKNSPDHTSLKYNEKDEHGFPSKEDLSQAYYQITADINFANYPEFTGFGTEENPFVGVIVGKDKGSNQYPVITMSMQSSAELTSYGFVQYAKGCVVKGLSIRFEQPVIINAQVTKLDEKTQQEVTVDEGGIGGGVIATVNGGENIIDNVSVEGADMSGENPSNYQYCFSPKNKKAVIGGYVGLVNHGGVILRNVDVESLQRFTLNYLAGGSSTSEYLYCCSMIGRVKDGYVLYDGIQTGTTNAVLNTPSDFQTGLSNDILPLSRSYAIVNKAYLNAQTASSKIQYNSTGYSISNAAQLQIISMALNSGALTYKGTDKTVGYSASSRQRHGNYDDVGNCTNDDNENRKAVIEKDNFNTGNTIYNYDSVLFEYFVSDNSNNSNFTDNISWTSGNYRDGTGVAGLNPEGNGFSYLLSGDTEYNMSVYQTAFRGLGARYFSGDNVFHCNFGTFDDKIANIKVNMIVDGIQDAENAALLNNVTVSKSDITISNITLSGTIENKSEIEGKEILETLQEHNAGGFISILDTKSGINFTNVSLDGLIVRSQKYAGGLVAYDDNINTKTISLVNCGIVGNAESDNVIKGMSDTGGFIGYTNSTITCTLNQFENVSVISGNVSASATQRSIGGNAGGLVARVDNKGITVNPGSDGIITCSNIKVLSAGMPVKIGGVVGWCKDATMNQLNLTNLEVGSVYDNSTYKNNEDKEDKIVGIAGVIGFVTGKVNIDSVSVGSNDTDQFVNIHLDNSSMETNFAGLGGIIGRTHSNVNMELKNCALLGDKDGEECKTVLSGNINVGGLVSNTRTFEGSDLSVKGVKLITDRYVGGVTGYHESDKNFTSQNINVENVHIAFSKQGYNNDGGFAGGISGCVVGNFSVTGAKVDALTVDSSFCNCVGGFVGRIDRDGTFTLLGENAVKNSKLCGAIVGGSIGYVNSNHTNKDNRHTNITIQNNILLTNPKSSYNNSYKPCSVGGYLGANGSSEMNLTLENIKIQDNLIAGYASDKSVLYIGGLVGVAKNMTDLYGLRLKDNYIGRIKASSENYDNGMIAMKTSDISTLKDNLYYTQCTNNSSYQSDQTKYAASLDEDNRYQYSYHQGTILGYCNDNSFSRLINVSVYYTNPQYRPISDVGMDKTYNLTSNKDMYGKIRDFAAIVYDGEVQNSPQGVSIPSWLSSDGTIIDEPYVFGNLEHIMTDANNCYYWLEKNYQNSVWIDDTTNTTNLSIENIYKNTYKDGDNYKSQLKVNDQIVPVIVYDSADNGTLDQVIHSYINMLTNNSGALNSKVAANDKSINVSVSKIRISGSSITKESGDTSVICSKKVGTNDYIFDSATQGDELNTDTGEGTFSMIHIDYNDKSGGKKWFLDIPVYVEKRLKIYSNMRMMSGTKYDTKLVKTNGSFMTDEDSKQIVLPMGTGYSVYCEYIYGDILDGMSSIQIPKTFYLDGTNASGGIADVSFIKGSKITLVPINANGYPGVPYYYTVEQENQTKIDFVDFKDEFNGNYSLENIIGKEKKSEYTDVCNKSYSDVVVEQFMIYVDPPEIDKETYSLYKLRVIPDWSSSQNQYDALRTRTDIIEHCFERVLELPGVKYDIVDSKTVLDSNSKLSNDGKIKVDLQYNIVSNPAYWNTTRNENLYLDIAFSIVKQSSSDSTKTKMALPGGTVVSYGDSETAVIGVNQESVYYYQGINSGKQDPTYIQINTLQNDLTKDISILLDFSNANMDSFDLDKDSKYYVVADLIITSDKDLPAAGEVKDTWQAEVAMEAKDDIGFSLAVDDMKTLGMNQYEPEASDSGVVPYTANIAFPASDIANTVSKNYTIVYEIEEKTSQSGDNGKPVYETYTGDDVSLYLGRFDDIAMAKQAAESSSNTENSGKGITSVTYHFKDTEMNQIIDSGMVLQDGKNTSDVTGTPGVLTTYCTLVAKCENLNMTNYRVKAYLVVEDSHGGMNQKGCMDKAVIRTANWANATGITEDMKQRNDYFVFTVAKIKTSLK